jgi:hypothetical protein
MAVEYIGRRAQSVRNHCAAVESCGPKRGFTTLVLLCQLEADTLQELASNNSQTIDKMKYIVARVAGVLFFGHGNDV